MPEILLPDEPNEILVNDPPQRLLVKHIVNFQIPIGQSHEEAEDQRPKVKVRNPRMLGARKPSPTPKLRRSFADQAISTQARTKATKHSNS